jgi:hypothetical protein
MQSERWRCLYLSAYLVVAITLLMEKDRKLYEARAEGRQAK